MAVFRVDKNRGYTVMSNYHLKDKSISLKAKGLLSMILSLPDEWNYTTRGLAAICKEGVESIGTTLKELETVGYLGREQVRDERGRIKDVEYTIYERPQKKQADKEKGKPGTRKEKKGKVDADDGKSEQKDADDPGVGRSDTNEPDTDEPDTGKPDTGHPDTDLPDTGFPDMDNPDTDLPDTENPAQFNTNRSNTHLHTWKSGS